MVVELPRDSTLELHSFSANTMFTNGRAAFKLMVQAGDQRVGPGCSRDWLDWTLTRPACFGQQPYELAHVMHKSDGYLPRLAASARLSHKFAASGALLSPHRK